MADITRHFMAPRRHPGYEGHFPGNPVVPGALLLHWVCKAVEDVYAGRQVLTIRTMKFLAPVRPGDALLLRVSLEKSGDRCRVTVVRGDEMVAGGTLRIEPEGAV